MKPVSREARTLIRVWAALLLLLALTTGATFAPLGHFKPVVNLAVAFAKAGLILWFFMDLKRQGGVARLAATAAAAWLLLLLSMTQIDVLTRSLFGR